MGKSIKGKELGKGITQRKSDGLYQGRFVNRFGKTQTIYASNLNELRKRMREEQYEDEKALNVVTKDVTLDEWYEIWMNTCKKNCRNSTRESYATHYKRIQKELGWRKLTSLNLIIMQNALNELVSDNARKNTKKIPVDMLEKAANGTYQLILMDIQMPVMNGYDAARKIRGLDDPKKANIPIIAMTANAFTEDRQVALDAGMNDHIAKPINMNVLVPTLRKYL